MTESPLTLLLVDEDPVFRLGLRIWLEQRPEFQVADEVLTAEEALQRLSELQAAAIDSLTNAGAVHQCPAVDVVILGLELGMKNPDQLPGLQLCQQIKQTFPRVAVLVLSTREEPVLQAAAKQMGADAFGPRGSPVQTLVRLIHQAAAGREQRPETSTEVALPRQPDGPVIALHRASLKQIDTAMAEIERVAAQQLPYWYRLVLAGRYRELRAARWLVQRLLRLPVASKSSPATVSVPEVASKDMLSNSGTMAALQTSSLISTEDIQTRVFEAVFRKLQFSLNNRSDIPLEIDILSPDKARELLFITLRTFEALLEDLKRARVPPGQVETHTTSLLYDLWEAVTVEFFGRYYTPPVNNLEQPLVTLLLQDAAVVQTAILSHIPEAPALISHLLFQTSLDVDGVAHGARAVEALRRSQFLLENLLIQVACGVMQPLLNRYGDVELFKRNLYQRHIVSTRDITRFRNELSWRYRWDSLVNEPKAIFESQYRLFALTPEGIQAHQIYAPRQEELETLSGFQYGLTLALEFRDAIAPRLQSTFSLVGSGVIFVLTEIIGRGIGLIGRGVFKGIGNAWQDSRLRQRQRDRL